MPLARHLLDDDLDVVAGWRKKRHDTFLTRRLPSLLANRLIGRMTGVRLHDYGCTLKVFRAAVLKQVPLFGEMHRFIPAWLVTVIPARRIAELPVNHAPRRAGTSKYGLWRTVHVVLDLLVVYFFLRYNARPGPFLRPARPRHRRPRRRGAGVARVREVRAAASRSADGRCC